jgi:hypothetical protein
MTEEINNYPNNDHCTLVQNRNQQYTISGEQVQRISKFLLEYPEAALNVHKFLEKNYSNQQRQVDQPMNSTPKRGHPLDDSGGSINNGSGRRQHPRKRFQQSKEKYISDAHQEIRTQPQQQSFPSSSDVQSVSNQNINQRKRLSFGQLKYAVSSNLPCVHIQFASDADRNNVPSVEGEVSYHYHGFDSYSYCQSSGRLMINLSILTKRTNS